MKVCAKCKAEKPLGAFYKNRTKGDGFASSCKVCTDKYSKQYYGKYKEKLSKYYQEHRQKNKERYLKYGEEYRKNNKDKINNYAKQYFKKRMETEPNFKIHHTLNKRLGNALKSKKKSLDAEKLLGCTLEFFREYIASKFIEGMAWGNYGYYGWHLDHIVPCAKFVLSDVEQQKQCFHYTNMQPLWAEDNLKKGDRETENIQLTFI